MKKAMETQNMTAETAYHLWEKRGCPHDSPDEDWFEAERQLTAERSAEVAEETTDTTSPAA